jgi:hypothetical protein
LCDLYRKGTGLTPRKLRVFIRGLPAEAWLWAEIEAAERKALKPTEDKIRERQEFYARKRREAAEEAPVD